MIWIYSFLILDTILIVGIVIYLILFNKKYKEQTEKIYNEIDEDRKRIAAISNALPRTVKEGALGYKVSIK